MKLIYIDPPFDVGADFSMDIEIGGETFHKEANLLEQIAYRDTWGRGADSFISMIYERLVLMRDLMTADGSIYIHIGSKVSHLIRVIAEEVFGRDNSRAEIIWKRTSAHANVTNNFGAIHDTVFFLTKSDQWTWNQQYAKYGTAYLALFFDQVDERGRRYARRDLTASMTRASSGQIYTWKGITPVGSRCWAMTKEKMDELDAQGRIHWPKEKGGMPRLKFFEDEAPGVPLQDIWDDVGAMHNLSKERLDYPTQKPESFVERLIQTSSNEGDLVADFFCGSGTTAAVAEKLGRKWIATDLGKFGIHTTRKRLIGVQRELKAAEKDFRAFEVLNLGRYERQAYLNVTGRLTGKQKAEALATKEREFRELILRAYKAEPLQGESFFHGKNAGRLVVVGPINLPVGRLFVEEVITECRKRGASRADVLAFEFEMGLFPAALEEAKSKGIDLAPKYIPAEVFDKRAVERGQVVFHDVSFVEATPRYAKGKSAKDKLTITIELTDFSVYYTQGAAEAAIASMKEGKSEVMCEQGQLIKVSKDKNGVVTRDVLTKLWTDWVDYWAVDFDYLQRKEIIKVPRGLGLEGTLPGVDPVQGELTDFEERWTGGYIFENEWQSFRTRQNRKLELITAAHNYQVPGRYTVAVKVIDIFGNDTMTLVPVNVG